MYSVVVQYVCSSAMYSIALCSNAACVALKGQFAFNMMLAQMKDIFSLIQMVDVVFLSDTAVRRK